MAQPHRGGGTSPGLVCEHLEDICKQVPSSRRIIKNPVPYKIQGKFLLMEKSWGRLSPR